MGEENSEHRSCILCNHLAYMGCRSLGWCLLLWGADGDLALQSLSYSAGVLPLKGDKLNFVYVAKLSIPGVFQTSAQLHSGSSVSYARPVPSSETASSCLLTQPSQHGAQKTNNLNLFVTLEIASGPGRFAGSSPGRCYGTCRRHLSIWSRNWEQGSVPETSQAVLGACV